MQRLFRHPQWNIGILRVPASALLRPGGYADDRIEWFPLAGRKRFRGELVAVGERSVQVAAGESKVDIPFEAIVRGNLVDEGQ